MLSWRLASVVRRLPSRCMSTKRKTPFPGDDVLVPAEPVISEIDDSLVPPVPEFDRKLISHLERLSLVRFSDEEAVANLRQAVQRANRLQLVDVEGVEPMYTVWEDRDCPLRDDIPEDSLPAEKVLSNAARTMEGYFVTPPGNIPLEETATPLDVGLINQWDRRGVASVVTVKQRAKQNK